MAKELDAKGKKDNNKILEDRTIDRHIEAWIAFQHRSEWLYAGIPQTQKKKFQPGQIEAYDRKRETIPAFEPAEKDSLLFAATIQDHFSGKAK